MRILFFSSIFPQPNDVTRGIYNYHLCRMLAREHTVQVVAPWAWWSKLSWSLCSTRGPSIPSADGVPVNHPTFYYPPRLLRNQRDWFMWHSAKKTLRNVFAGERPSVVLSYWTHPDGGAALRAAKGFSVPCVLQVGGSDALIELRKRSRRGDFLRVLHGVDLVIAVSEDIQNCLCEAGVPEGKVRVIPRGVDLERFSCGNKQEARDCLGLPQDRPVLLFVGNLVPIKGLDFLLAACERLKRRGLDFLQVIVGRGPLEAWLRRETISRELTPCVRIQGSVQHDRLPDWYRAADVTVLPSRSEGTPNVLMESIACGTPFVASRVGGIPDLATEPLDRLVAVGDVQGLVDAIASTLTSPAHTVPRRFFPCSWEHAAQLLLGTIAPLVAKVSR